MESSDQFIIYDASAGSGKTFSLVKEYLKVILSSPAPEYYNRALAITFTNKAVAEMKQRIIKSLLYFSKMNPENETDDMADQIIRETKLTAHDVQMRSSKVLKHLLHHYAGFAVETIDSFNHKLIRTFARDMQLAGNFEVSLDQKEVLSQAVGLLLDKAGTDYYLTDLLIEFALSKVDDDRSWDISRDITRAANLMFDENQIAQIDDIRSLSSESFQDLKNRLWKELGQIKKELVSIASNCLQLITDNSIPYESFYGRQYFPNYLQSLKSGDFSVPFGRVWQEHLCSGTVYAKNVRDKTPELAKKFDSLQPVFEEAFLSTKILVNRYKLYHSAWKNCTPLMVLNEVGQQLEAIQKEQNIVLITEFNSLINEQIKDQPAPFIYERLGEKFNHFFIDEFQDTSTLQWENLVPLIENSLSQENKLGRLGSLVIVGDVKQSIYRWRGGQPEQLMALRRGVHPFHGTHPKLQLLEHNYRSHDNVIKFNNELFSHIAQFFRSPEHREIYTSGTRQKPIAKEGGYVKIDFIPPGNKLDSQEIYAVKVLATISKLLENGYELKDICILTRKKEEGINLGISLTKAGFPIVSPDTSLLVHSAEVRFLVDCIHMSLFPGDRQIVLGVLEFIFDNLEIEGERHEFLSNYFSQEVAISEYLAQFEIKIDFSYSSQLPLYDFCEFCIQQFGLNNKGSSYVLGFLDLVHEFGKQPMSGKAAFLSYWETKQETATISTESGSNAIQLMTIHKAKGLEFPVVLFPYADERVHYEKDARTWFPFQFEDLPVDELLINFNRDVAGYGKVGQEIYDRRTENLEFDSLNLLYVALTRAREQLYVFAKYSNKLNREAPSTYGQFIQSFVEGENNWDGENTTYIEGNDKRQSSSTMVDESDDKMYSFISKPLLKDHLRIANTRAEMWASERDTAVGTGTLLHEVMSRIISLEDVDPVLSSIRSTAGETVFNQIEDLVRSIVESPELEWLYSEFDSVFNEREIVTGEGDLLRPDRINFNTDGTVSVVDYKTGAADPTHKVQIQTYVTALEEIGYEVKNSLIIYTSHGGISIIKN